MQETYDIEIEMHDKVGRVFTWNHGHYHDFRVFVRNGAFYIDLI